MERRESEKVGIEDVGILIDFVRVIRMESNSSSESEFANTIFTLFYFVR
jgi:hypothetical protein